MLVCHVNRGRRDTLNEGIARLTAYDGPDGALAFLTLMQRGLRWLAEDSGKDLLSEVQDLAKELYRAYKEGSPARTVAELTIACLTAWATLGDPPNDPDLVTGDESAFIRMLDEFNDTPDYVEFMTSINATIVLEIARLAEQDVQSVVEIVRNQLTSALGSG
jgi:hypothetical protein